MKFPLKKNYKAKIKPHCSSNQQRRSVTAYVGEAFHINSSTEGAQDKPRVGMNSEGDFVVVWQSAHTKESGGASLSIWGQCYFADGSKKSTEFRVSQGSTGSASEPDVELAEDGSFSVVWSGDGEPEELVGNTDWSETWIRQFESDGTDKGDTFKVNTYIDFKQQEASIAVDLNGNYVVVWNDFKQEQNTTEGDSENESGIYAKLF